MLDLKLPLKKPTRVSTFSSTTVEIGEEDWKVKFESWCETHLNFYRVHLLAIVLISFIGSGLFYISSNDDVAYVDALFVCVSATTVTGLQSILVNPLSTWQQVVLYMCNQIGSIPVVAFLTVVVRLHFFRKQIKTDIELRPGILRRVRKQVVRTFTTRPSNFGNVQVTDPELEEGAPPTATGWLGRWIKATEKKQDEEHVEEPKAGEDDEENGENEAGEGTLGSSANGSANGKEIIEEKEHSTHLIPILHEPEDDNNNETRDDQVNRGILVPSKRPTLTLVDTNMTNTPLSLKRRALTRRGTTLPPTSGPLNMITQSPAEYAFTEAPFRRATDVHRHRLVPKATMGAGRGPQANHKHRNMYRGHGGFSNPVEELAKWGVKSAHRALTTYETRPLKITKTKTILDEDALEDGEVELEDVFDKVKNYLTFNTKGRLGKNSRFVKLTLEEQEELGGVEFKALIALSWIAGGYWVGFQLISVLILAPYLKAGHFKDVFEANGNPDTTWYSFFVVASALSNNGLSLVDASLVPFQKAYLLSILCAILIVSGNTCYPIILRFIIWSLNKIRPSPTLQFLLDHPRRCFLYLFPSYQTWFLLIIFIIFLVVDWLSLLLLNIGLPAIEAIPVGQRIGLTLIQSLLIRSAGMQLIPIGSLSPAQLFWYMILMYITVYPIAVSIRSTNVYENKSIGVFETETDTDEEEAEMDKKNDPGEYIGYHARKLLGFDIWWLVLSIWLICISERGLIRDPTTNDWFNFQTVIFEVTSAYGCTGLSTGVPYASFSLSGAFNTFSKIVICVVMIRGRHRGLPLAIDRSVLTPSTLMEHGEWLEPGGAKRRREAERRDAMLVRSMSGIREEDDNDEDDGGALGGDGQMVESPVRASFELPVGQREESVVHKSPLSIPRVVSFEPKPPSKVQ